MNSSIQASSKRGNNCLEWTEEVTTMQEVFGSSEPDFPVIDSMDLAITSDEVPTSDFDGSPEESCTLSPPESSATGSVSPRRFTIGPQCVKLIKQRINTQKIEFTEAKSCIIQANTTIRRLEASSEEFAKLCKSKTAEIKAMEGQRKALIQQIKKAKVDKIKATQGSNTVYKSLTIEYSKRAKAQNSADDLESSIEELEAELNIVEQHLEINDQFPDEDLRQLARGIRNVPKTPKHNILKHDDSDNDNEVEDGENSDDEVEKNAEMAMYEKWKHFDTAVATLDDLSGLQDDLETIDHKTKRDSNDSVVKLKESEDVQRHEEEEAENPLVDPVSSGTSDRGDDTGDNSLKFTSAGLKAHFQAAKYHSVQIERYMVALRGGGHPKRKVEEDKDDDESEVKRQRVSD